MTQPPLTPAMEAMEDFKKFFVYVSGSGPTGRKKADAHRETVIKALAMLDRVQNGTAKIKIVKKRRGISRSEEHQEIMGEISTEKNMKKIRRWAEKEMNAAPLPQADGEK